jgi:hypothetical protein
MLRRTDGHVSVAQTAQNQGQLRPIVSLLGQGVGVLETDLGFLIMTQSLIRLGQMREGVALGGGLMHLGVLINGVTPALYGLGEVPPLERL